MSEAFRDHEIQFLEGQHDKALSSLKELEKEADLLHASLEFAHKQINEV
jgi:hypothetical protein